MKQLLTILLLLPWGLQAQETCDTDYRSPRIHYYVSCPDGSDTRRQADPGQAVRAGSDIWILLLQDGGNAVLAKHAGKDLHYGIRERKSTYGPLTRREAVKVLNRWIAHYCHLTEQDRKEGRIGYNTPCYTGIADSPLKVGPDFRSGNSLSLKEGERGWRFIHTGAYSEETGMELWTSRDFRRAVYYRSGELPGTDRAGHRNYTLLQECDIEDCLPRSRTSGEFTFLGVPLGRSLEETKRQLRDRGFAELSDDDTDAAWDEYDGELAGLLGSSADQATLEGDLYGMPCLVVLQADPQNEKVYSVSGRLLTHYPTLQQARRPFDILTGRLSERLGSGTYADSEQTRYVIRSGTGKIDIGIEKIGIALEDEGMYEITFLFWP